MTNNQLAMILACLREASKVVLCLYNTQNLQVSYKKDNSPVTKADIMSNKIVIDTLRAHSVYPILSEESIDDRKRFKSDKLWLVDPLDGTKEFISKSNEFTINIALICNQVPIFGAIAVPAQQVIYYGIKNKGAYIYDIKRYTHLRIGCSKGTSLQTARITVSRSHFDLILQTLSKQNMIKKYFPMGSALKYCRIAEGAFDGSIRKIPLMEWDIAAADCIVQEAYGKITDFLGRPLTYNKKNPQFVNGIVAGNTLVHNKLIKVVAKL